MDPADDSAATREAYRLLVEASTDIIVRSDLGGRLLYVSPACRVLGYEPDELIGRPAATLVHPDDLARWTANTAELFAGAAIDRTVDRAHRYLAKNGDWVWLEGNPQVRRDETGRPVEILNAFRDVSERKRVEAALDLARAQQRRQDERMAVAVGAAQVGIWEWDLDADTMLWDRRMYELYGLPWQNTAPSSATFAAMLHPDDRSRVLAEARAVMSGQAAIDAEFRVVAPDGSVRHIRSLATVIPDAAGASRRMVGTNWDITATRILEASLRASETRMQKVISNAHQAIVTVDAAGLITGWNRHAELIFGWTASEAFGERMGDLVFPRGDRAARAADFMRSPSLPEGRYLVKIYIDVQERLQKDFRAELRDEDLVGQVEFESRWPAGYQEMTAVSFPLP